MDGPAGPSEPRPGYSAPRSGYTLRHPGAGPKGASTPHEDLDLRLGSRFPHRMSGLGMHDRADQLWELPERGRLQQPRGQLLHRRLRRRERQLLQQRVLERRRVPDRHERLSGRLLRRDELRKHDLLRALHGRLRLHDRLLVHGDERRRRHLPPRLERASAAEITTTARASPTATAPPTSATPSRTRGSPTASAATSARPTRTAP